GGERHTGAVPFSLIARESERAQRHTVESIGECDNFTSPRDFAGDLERSFYGVGARWARKHNSVLEISRAEDQLGECLEELFFGHGGQIQRVGDAVVLDITEERVLEIRVVVPVVQSTSARKKIDVRSIAIVRDNCAFSRLECHWKGATVASY